MAITAMPITAMLIMALIEDVQSALDMGSGVFVARPLDRPHWPQVWQTNGRMDGQTDKHDKGALGLLV